MEMPDWQVKLAMTAQLNRLELVKAKLNRREMMRLGLLTAAGSLIDKPGLSATPGFTKSDDGMLNKDPRTFRSIDLTPGSPPARPWAQPMPRLFEKTPVAANALMHGSPDGTTLVEGAKTRVTHQFCSYNPADDTYGGRFAPRKFYEMFIQEAEVRLHPDYGTTTFWCF